MERVLSLLRMFKNLAGILGVVSFFIAMVVRFFLPELIESVLGLLILGIFLLLVFLLGAHTEINTFLFSKHGRFGLNTMIMIAVFIAIMICANYLGVTMHRRFDVTASSQFTLAPQTVNVIKNLQIPVKAIGFFPNDAQFVGAKRMAQNLLEEYRFFNRELSFRFVDPEVKPALAREHRVRYNGTIVFISGSRQKAVREINEQAFTGALLEVTGREAKKVYFLSGHGERDVNSNNQEGYSVARMGLIRDLYQGDEKAHNPQNTRQVFKHSQKG